MTRNFQPDNFIWFYNKPLIDIFLHSKLTHDDQILQAKDKEFFMGYTGSRLMGFGNKQPRPMALAV